MTVVGVAWWNRQTRASKTIQRWKQEDKQKGKPVYKQIGADLIQIETDYYRQRVDVINQLQVLNAQPDDLPEIFYSTSDLLNEWGILPEEQSIATELTDMIGYPSPDPNRFLSFDSLNTLTELWLTVYPHSAVDGGVFYYNQAFISYVLGRYKQAIRMHKFEEINLTKHGADKPLVYVHYPDRPIVDTIQVNTILNAWREYHCVFELENREGIQLLDRSARGGFIVSRDFPYGREYSVGHQQIYQIESLMFFGFTEALYKLSEQYPKCFGHGAQAILDGLYKYFNDALFGEERKLSQEEFELKFTQQFLYMANDNLELVIDLYRHLDETKEEGKTGMEFTNGLFHSFKHFKGLQPFQTNESITLHEGFLLHIIRDLFFNHLPPRASKNDGEGKYTAESIYRTPVNLQNGQWSYSDKNWHAVFHYSSAKRCYSLTTLHPIS